MKKITFLLVALMATMFCACSSDDDDKDEFYQKQVTATELEAGTATYQMTKGSKTYYLVFDDGALSAYEYKGGKITDSRYYDEYRIEGDSIYLTEKPFMEDVLGGETKHYSLYINMVHWGNKDSDQLLIRGDDVPYMFQTGYYDKSYTSLKLN